MNAIFKKELRVAFGGLFGYLVIAILLLFTGIFTVFFNILYGSPEFSVTLSAMGLVLAVLIPFLTMRTIAEERHNRTDKLLYSLPIKMRDVVLGKFLAMFALFAIPTAVSALYPLLLSFFGEISLTSAYVSLLGYLLLGGALIAICMFLSSLVENQVLAAVVSLTASLLLYFLDSAATIFPTGELASFVICVILSLGVGALFWAVSKLVILGAGVAAGLTLASTAVYLIKPALFEALFPSLLTKMALFTQFGGFTYGYLDLSVLVLYLSTIVLFLFLTVAFMEKRRLL